MRKLALAAFYPMLAAAALAAAGETAGEDPQAVLRAILQEAKRRVEAPPTEAEDTTDVEPEAIRKHALAVNLSLRNRFWDRAADLKAYEIRDLKRARMDECRQVAERIRSLEETIKEKERERRRALRGSLDGVMGSGGVRSLGGERLGGLDSAERRRHRRDEHHNDGLDKDKKALKQAKHDKRRLQAQIAAQMERLDQREDLRKRRVEAAYAQHKQAIEGGKTFSANQMIADYEAALNLPPAQHQPPEQKPQADAPEQGDRKKPRRPDHKAPDRPRSKDADR
ncbi:MAG: hypothetical protein ACODAJ_15115 [Planctomycetota bacterium]